MALTWEGGQVQGQCFDGLISLIQSWLLSTVRGWNEGTDSLSGFLSKPREQTWVMNPMKGVGKPLQFCTDINHSIRTVLQYRVIYLLCTGH